MKIDPGIHSIDTPKNTSWVCCSSSKSRNACSVVSFSPLLLSCYIRHSNRKLCTLTRDSRMKAEHHLELFHNVERTCLRCNVCRKAVRNFGSITHLFENTATKKMGKVPQRPETEFTGKAIVVRVATAGAFGPRCERANMLAMKYANMFAIGGSLYC